MGDIQAVCNGTPFMVEKMSTQMGLGSGIARSVGQHLM